MKEVIVPILLEQVPSDEVVETINVVETFDTVQILTVLLSYIFWIAIFVLIIFFIVRYFKKKKINSDKSQKR